MMATPNSAHGGHWVAMLSKTSLNQTILLKHSNLQLSHVTKYKARKPMSAMDIHFAEDIKQTHTDIIRELDLKGG